MTKQEENLRNLAREILYNLTFSARLDERITFEEAEKIIVDRIGNYKMLSDIEHPNVNEIIEKYSEKGFFIEILADCYKLEGIPSWRGYVHWKNGHSWASTDCGCSSEWLKAFKECQLFCDSKII